MSETLTGYVEKIVYRNEDNGYTVLTLNMDGEDTTCVGFFPFIGEGEYIEATGGYTAHTIYGEQFKVEGFHVREATDIKSMEKYLGSGAVKGIGEALAGRIVKKFMEDTLRIMEDEPERLAEVKGISKKSAIDIHRQFMTKKELRSAMIFLAQYGISNNLAVKIYNHYGERIYTVIRENPYQLAEDISGVGFKIADDIAIKAGILMDSDYRIRAAIIYALLVAANNGNVYLPEEELFRNTLEILGTNVEDIGKQVMSLAIERKIMIKEIKGTGERRIYNAVFYYLELNTSRMLCDLDVKYNISAEAIEGKLLKIEEKIDIELDEMQRNAVIAAVRNGLFILTGGPGTGKTTTINSMIYFFESEGMDILLAAPTGRAAKRMCETTRHEAKTIHRLLEVAPSSAIGDGDERMVFQRNEENPLECDVIIIDEMSMVDIRLMHAMLKAVPIGTRLVLVGDENQLPSVGPGNVLHDVIYSNAFETIRLNKIFRQANESDIIVNAHKINAGEQISINNKSKDFFMLKRDAVNAVIGVVISLVRDKMPKYVDARPVDIQVLTPMRKGELGVEKLNQVLQQYLNPPSRDKNEKEYQGITFREGDKVMQVKNNYQTPWEVRNKHGIKLDSGTGIFNGDMGVVKDINVFTEHMLIEFDEGKMVEYPFSQLEELEQAYAITVHKSQGSEYPAVVIPLLGGPRLLFNRNILYTAVTRARSCVTLVGSEEVVKHMISNEREQKRYSSLDLCIMDMV